MNFCLKEKGIKEMEIGKKKNKKKEKPSPSSAGPFPAHSLLCPHPPLRTRPSTAQPPRLPALASCHPLTDRPHPSASLASLSRDRSSSGKRSPPVSPFVPARDFTGRIPADRPLSLIAITPAPVKLGTAPSPSSLCSHPFTIVCPSGLIPSAVHPHRRRGVPRLCHLVFGRFPPRVPIKRTAQAPPFLTLPSATSLPLPRAQSSQRRRSLPPLW
jgi:hypothetical protein